MANHADTFSRSLAWVKDAHAILEKARHYRAAYPDLKATALQQARDYLASHTGMALDPEQVWWHAFDPRERRPADTFSGWSHRHPPVESLRFSDLWIRRFSQYFQYQDTRWDSGGFYNQDGTASEFGAHNEVKLDPRKVMDDFWALNFAAVMRERKETFWRNEGLDLPLLLKVRFLADIEESLADRSIEEHDRAQLWSWMGLEPGRRINLFALSERGGGAGFVVQAYQMEGAGHLLILTGEGGRQLLYTPTATPPMRGFSDKQALRTWVTQRLHDEDAQAWFDSLHKAHGQLQDVQRKAQFKAVLDRSGTPEAPRWPFGQGHTVSQLLFDEMRDWIKEDLESSFRLLVSNGDLRRQHWRDLLGNAIVVLGVFALVGEPVGMLLLIVGIARLGLDIDAYVNAHSEAQRHEAFAAAIGDLLVVAFSAYSEALPGAAPEQWDSWMAVDEDASALLSRAVRQRHRKLLNRADLPRYEGHMAPLDEYATPHVPGEGKRFYSFKHEGEVHNNLIEQYSSHMAKANDVFSIGRERLAAIPEDELTAYLDHLFDSIEQLPASEAKVLWRGGRGPRVTVAARWRAGNLKQGDVLVSTDITSFTENPYIPRRFMLPKEAVDLPLEQVAGHFDDNTVLYELLADGQASGVPVSTLSLNWQEAEVLFTPGRYFRIESAGEVGGSHYRFLRIRLREVPRPAGQPVYAMRTGLPFDRQAYQQLVGHDPVVERFFNAADWA